MTVAFAELGQAVRRERHEIRSAIDRVLDSGRYVGGPEVEAFEREWGAACGAYRCVAVASGTDAIKIALRVFGSPGGRVLTVPNSAPATVTAIVEAGMKPIFCDVIADGPDAGLMDLDHAEDVCRRNRPSVLMPVHLYGRMVDMARVEAIGEHHGVTVVEDACQAHGSEDGHGTRPGERSAAACWSFYPTKNLGALGDAGAITMHGIGGRCGGANEAMARRLANYGLRDRAELVASGYNSRMDPVQAAILRSRIPRLAEYNRRRAEMAATYRSGLVDAGVSVVAGGNHHIVAIRSASRDGTKALRREALARFLADQGIVTHIHYQRPAHRQPCFDKPHVSLPHAERWCQEILSLPLSNYTTREQAKRVVEAIIRFRGRH